MVRARIAVSIVSALALVVLVSGPVPQTDDVHPTLGSAAIGGAHALAKVPPTGTSGRARPAFLASGRLSQLQGIAVLCGLVGVGVIGGFRRRITDAGHDWRALLVGAPPPLA